MLTFCIVVLTPRSPVRSRFRRCVDAAAHDHAAAREADQEDDHARQDALVDCERVYAPRRCLAISSTATT
ncbi:MAG: hypothetical protein AVDCRST_MAG85-2418 [uncultured Solirubrobacteraceae bacterium]|uniref:Uncharacterized protein n=1 Tax=uncultured Solirubrobacteraceae bacterium TaxID=1162706 RepID=A0A6J4T3J6_9ACTN|nr:MAG: hypothetical protein AVDCRST_MAG85-2418 [uncultured Solirubrobacteraceae bacterium]